MELLGVKDSSISKRSSVSLRNVNLHCQENFPTNLFSCMVRDGGSRRIPVYVFHSLIPSRQCTPSYAFDIRSPHMWRCMGPTHPTPSTWVGVNWSSGDLLWARKLRWPRSSWAWTCRISSWTRWLFHRSGTWQFPHLVWSNHQDSCSCFFQHSVWHPASKSSCSVCQQTNPNKQFLVPHISFWVLSPWKISSHSVLPSHFSTGFQDFSICSLFSVG